MPVRNAFTVSEKNSLLTHLPSNNKKISLRNIAIAISLVFLGSVIVIKRSHNHIDVFEIPDSPQDFPGVADEVIDLPELPDDYFGRHYSGYLQVGESGMLHYWFVESLRDPQKDPVVLWLNGGPGASSLSGMLYENGPFLMTDDGKLKTNPYTWNSKANMLYFEAPIGVGFSYDKQGKYDNGDFIQAKHNRIALQEFFNKFPHFQKNDFIVTGESYGGVYVPTLAKEIVEWNLQNPASKINIKAFAVGNGVNEFHANSQLYFSYYHGLYGMNRWKQIREDCPTLREFNVAQESFFDILPNHQDKCSRARAQALAYITSSHVNSYDIYRKCAHGDPEHGVNKLLHSLKNTVHRPGAHPITQPLALPLSLCLNSTAGSHYLNRKDVKKALHVPEDLEWTDIAMTNISMAGFAALNITTDKPILNYGTPLNTRVVPIWKFLLKNNIRGVIYHGDVDVMCDFIGGQWAVESLSLPEVKPYSPWHLKNEFGEFQAGGFIKEFKGLIFITIKGAGHMAPQWRPQESTHMFEKYILQCSDLDT